MATLNQVLKSLTEEAEPVLTGPLAKKLSSTEDTMRSQLSKLKAKGYVDGSSKEGWVITLEGREAVEREEKIPVTPQDVGADTESKLKYFGNLAGVPPELILATIELTMTGDPENLEQVWNAMTQMDVPIAARRRWFNLWRNHLKQGIPPDLKEKVVGAAEGTKEEGEEGAAVSARDRGRDYIIVEDLPVFVGYGQGDYSLKDAKDIIGIRAIRARVAATSGGGGQQWGPQDIIQIIEKIDEKRGQPGASKTYVVQPTDQGAVVKEVQPGEPVVLGQPGGSKPPQTFFVDSRGNVSQVEPGKPLVIKQESGAPPVQKTLVVRQTDKGIVTEEYEAGKPIILSAAAGGGAGFSMLPFPVFGNDGKPILDSEGRPVYANLEPTLRFLGFQAEQRRADQRHEALMGLVQTVREHADDGIAALKAAAEEAKKEREGTSSQAAKQQIYECGQCKTRFTIQTMDFQTVACPNCKHEYTRQEVLG